MLSVLWGLPRPTGDVDFIDVRPLTAGEALLRLAGEGTALARKHDLHVQYVTVAEYRDRADVEYLARKGVLDRRRLEERFEAELRPNLLNENREALTLELWLAEFFGKEER